MSDTIKDGGPAFPTLNGHPNPKCDGMTLRDYFAGQLLVGLAATGRYLDMANDQVAKETYIIADAMLAERNAHKEPTT